jgi:hypothetical protein
MIAGQRRHVPDPETFGALGLRWGELDRMPDAVVATIPAGPPLASFNADGTLMQGSSAAVYVREGGLRRHVTSPEVMAACGYDWGAVLRVTDEALATLPEGPPVGLDDCPGASTAAGETP